MERDKLKIKIMQSKDLRIGNLIKNIDYEEPIDVQGICESQVEDDVVIIISDCEEFNLKDCTGIPLSIDWLKAFSFKQDDEIDYHWVIKFSKTTWFIVSYNCTSEEYYLCNSTFPVEFNFVHELQNLYFALVGEELEYTYMPEP